MWGKKLKKLKKVFIEIEAEQKEDDEIRLPDLKGEFFYKDKGEQ